MNLNQSKLIATVSIDLTDIPKSFEILEQKIALELKKTKLELLQQSFALFEKSQLKKARYILKDRRPKLFHTTLGEISYSRYRVFDRKLKKNTYLLDDWLGLVGSEKVSSLLKNEIIRLAVDVPFRFVAREIEHWTHNRLSKDVVWSLSQKVGNDRWNEKSSKRVWNRHEALPKPQEVIGDNPPADLICIGLDATYVKRQEKKHRVKTKHDMKVAVLYTGKEKENGDQKLTDKSLVVASPHETLDHFLGRVVTSAIENYGLNQNTKVLLFGDGDAWIRRFREFIPQAHYRLDPWHVFEKIKLHLGVDQIPSDWIKLVYGKPDELIFEIQKHEKALCDDIDKLKANELINYLKNNREGLLPWKIDEETQRKNPELFKWGSGHVESQIELAVCDRHKQNRMSWSKKGLQNLSTLREDKLNQHRKPKFKFTTPPKAFRIDLGALGVLSVFPH